MTQTEKHIWLIDAINRAGRISLKNLSEKWECNVELSCGKPLQRCTLNRWRNQILLQYGIEITCESNGSYRYYIANPEAIEENKLRKWMLDSVAVGNVIASYKDLGNRIVVQQIPSGRDFLTVVLGAMRENKVLCLTYQAFGHAPYTFNIEPYCLKLHQNRWYVLAKGENGKLWLYSLDRIKHLTTTDKTFSMPKDFDAEAFFALYFGIIVYDGAKPCRIVLRVYGSHVNYLRTLPLHQSQKEIHTEEGKYSDFEYFVAPTYDLSMAILGMGNLVEVLQPTDYRKQIADTINELAKRYAEQ